MILIGHYLGPVEDGLIVHGVTKALLLVHVVYSVVILLFDLVS